MNKAIEWMKDFVCEWTVNKPSCFWNNWTDCHIVHEWTNHLVHGQTEQTKHLILEWTGRLVSEQIRHIVCESTEQSISFVKLQNQVILLNKLNELVHLVYEWTEHTKYLVLRQTEQLKQLVCKWTKRMRLLILEWTTDTSCLWMN